MHAEQVILCYQKLTSVYLTFFKNKSTGISIFASIIMIWLLLYFITVGLSFRNIRSHVILLSTDPL